MKTFFALVATLGFTVSALFAGNNQPQQPPPPDPVLVKSVDATAHTITVGRTKGDPQTFTLNAFTRVIVDGKQATLEQVQVGMRADVTSNDGKTASRVVADTYTPKPVKKK
jgi:hypothetical protein